MLPLWERHIVKAAAGDAVYGFKLLTLGRTHSPAIAPELLSRSLAKELSERCPVVQYMDGALILWLRGRGRVQQSISPTKAFVTSAA